MAAEINTADKVCGCPWCWEVQHEAGVKGWVVFLTVTAVENSNPHSSFKHAMALNLPAFYPYVFQPMLAGLYSY